ncbi:MAG: phosphatase PAP2 family protein, partial [Candidatus Pacebacteria bacterium]|nr:phosphatase PAP2 family protein [Candidatus Paceibacterota bacterium]
MNQTIFRFFNDFALRNELADTLIIFSADWLIWWMLFAVAALIFLKKITWKLGFQVLVVAVFAWALTEFFQFFYFVPRPFIALDNLNLLFAHGATDSFPSGHTAFAFALAASLYLSAGMLNKKISALFF